MGNLAALLEDTTAKHGDRTAIVFGDTTLSYAQVNGASNQVANLLVSRGIGRGDKVALSCPNLPVLHHHLLRHPQGRCHRGAAERAAQGPRGRVPPGRLRGQGLLRLRGFGRPAHRRCRVGGLRGHRLVRRVLLDQARLGRARPRSSPPSTTRRWSPSSRPRSTWSTPMTTTPPSSSTRPARPASPREPSCGTATCATTRWPARTCSALTRTTPTPTCACCRCSTPSARP